MAAVSVLTVMSLWAGGARPAAGLTTINTVPFTLSTPGETYVLNANLTAAESALTITASNVTLNLNGRTLTGRGTGIGVAAVGGSRVQIVGSGVIQGFTIGVSLLATTLSQVQDVEVRDCDAGVVLAIEASDNVVQRVRSHGNGLAGIWLAIIQGTADRNFVLGNWCYDNGEGIIVETDNNRVGGNLLTDNEEEGIFIVGNNNEILSNRCNANGLDGIGLFDASGNRVRLNNCIGNGFDGISLLGDVRTTLVEANACSANEDVGISLIEGGNNNNTLRGNACNENGLLGIGLDGPNSGNLIEANTCIGSFLAGILLLEENRGNTIRGNNVRATFFVGIDIDTGATGNTITGNTAIANGLLDLLDDNAGLFCANTWSGNSYGRKGGTGVACIN